MAINLVCLTGNITRDPELRTTAGGMGVLSFSIAVNERYKNNKTDKWEDRPNYFECTMFGARATSVAKYLSKGSKVSIEGKLRWSQWEQDGNKRSKVEVIVNEIEFMSSRKDAAAPTETVGEYYTEDIPF